MENVKSLEILPKLDNKVMAVIEEILGNKPKIPGPFPPSRAQMTLNEALKSVI
jgi:hypothetical protein